MTHHALPAASWLPAVGRGKIAPLSLQQQDAYAAEIARPGAVFNPDVTLHIALRIRGALKANVLGDAFESVVLRHSALRTRLAAAEEGVVQEELSKARSHVVVTDAASSTIEDLVRASACAPVSPGEPPLVRCDLHRLCDDDHVIVLVVHHLACDADGLAILARDLGTAYGMRLAGNRLAALPAGYGDYARWQSERCKASFASDHAFWREQLSDIRPAEIISDAAFSPDVPPQQRWFTETLLDAPAWRSIPISALRLRSSALLSLMGAFQVALTPRTTSPQRLLVTILDRRDPVWTRDMVGHFAHPLIVPWSLKRDAPVAQQLHGLTQAWREPYARANLSLLSMAGLNPSLASPLVGATAPWFFLLNYIPRPQPSAVEFGDLGATVLGAGMNGEHGMPGFALRLHTQHDGSLLAEVQYDQNQWHEESMRALVRVYRRILASFFDPRMTSDDLLALCGNW